MLVSIEVAIAALRPKHLADGVNRHDQATLNVQHLRDNPGRWVATVQLWMTASVTCTAVLASTFWIDRLTRAIAEVPLVAPFAPTLATVAVVLGVTYGCVVLGELLPAALALRAPLRHALRVGTLTRWLTVLSRPLTFFLTAGFQGVWRRLSGKSTGAQARRDTSEELQAMVNEATKCGSVHPGAAEIAARALTFGDLTVSEVMVPRNRVKAVSLAASVDELQRVLLEDGHSRMPVFDGTLDQVVGVLVAKDVLALAWERELIMLHDLVQPAYFAPEIMRAVDLLQDLQRRRLSFAVAVDELGGTAGIVTMEDLLEELVGEIFGEHDKEAPAMIRPEADGSALLQGIMPIRDANRELPADLPEGDAWSTVAGLCVSLAGRIPDMGQKLSLEDGTILEVVDASPRRVRMVRIRPNRGSVTQPRPP